MLGADGFGEERKEKALQWVWVHQPWGQRARLVARDHRGRRVALQVRFPGRWNGEAGPDFLSALLWARGRLWRGDVEVHLSEEDFYRHGHAEDRRYERVRLHVILQPGPRRAVRRDGRTPLTLDLRPWLPPGWEEAFPGVREGVSPWEDRPTELFRQEELRWRASQRWGRLLAHAESLVTRLGEEAAAHALLARSLGDVRNGAQLEGLAGRVSWRTWRDREVEELARCGGPWVRTGVRPGARAEARIGELQRFYLREPRWPGLWEEGRERRSLRRVKEALRQIWGEARCRTILVDGVLPWAAAVSGEAPFWAEAWFRSPMGAMPLRVRGRLRELGVERLTNGWGQGVLGVWEALGTGPSLGRRL